MPDEILTDTTETAPEEPVPILEEEAAAEPVTAAASEAPVTREEGAAAAPVETSAPEETPAPAEAPAPSEAVAVETPASESMEEMIARNAEAYERSFPTLSEGDVVQGVVVHIDREGVLVDVGAKSEGIIRLNELSREANVAPESVVSVGEKIDVYVVEADSQDGSLILSKKRADFEKAWERVQQAKEENRTLMAMVTERVKGGLVVDLGIRGFVPASHVGNGSLKINLDRYVGQSIPLKVLEVDKDRRKVVLSNKLAVDEERAQRKAQTIASLQPGQIRRGIVRRLTNYGAFVDLGGIDGLLHISEMSWSRINHPQEVLREGQEIDVLVLKMDLDAGRVSLGLRQILPDPWSDIEARYHVGDVIKGTVSRQVPFGFFVQVEGGIEGIIPKEMVSRRGKGGGGLSPGMEVEVEIVELRPEERKMTLSPRLPQPEGETGRRRRETEESNVARDEPRFTIGDALRAKEEAEQHEE